MNFGDFKAITIPEGKVKKIESEGVLLWKGGYTNMVPLSTDANGNIYNDSGYKDGYRIRSSGAEATGSGVSCTGFIPCKAGDVLRFCFTDGKTMWLDFSTYVTSLNFYDGSKTNLGQFTSQPAHYGIFSGTNEYLKVTKNGSAWEYTVADNASIAYVRFTIPMADNSISHADRFVVTVNEEIE